MQIHKKVDTDRQRNADTTKNHRYNKNKKIQQKITDTAKTSRYTKNHRYNKNMYIQQKHVDTQNKQIH